MKKNNEKLLYQANSGPFGLALMYLPFNTAQTIFTLNTIDPSAAGIRVMETILLNILLSFLVFIISTEIKRYSIRWSHAGLATGLFQLARLFFNPTGPGGARPLVLVPLAVAGIFLIWASLWSAAKCRSYNLAKKELVCHT
ncbi:MAG: hypothetical protein FWF29_04905 [Treponema sp.]|nr:hypothetical protein [Treponema sp.]